MLALRVFSLPTGAAFADTGDDADYDSYGQEYAENRVLVMYEEGAIDTDTSGWKVSRQSTGRVSSITAISRSTGSMRMGKKNYFYVFHIFLFLSDRMIS